MRALVVLLACAAGASRPPRLRQLEREAGAYTPWSSKQWSHDRDGNIVVDSANFKQVDKAAGPVIEQWHQTQNERRSGVQSWTNVQLKVGDGVVPGIMFAQERHEGQQMPKASAKVAVFTVKDHDNRMGGMVLERGAHVTLAPVKPGSAALKRKAKSPLALSKSCITA